MTAGVTAAGPGQGRGAGEEGGGGVSWLGWLLGYGNRGGGGDGIEERHRSGGKEGVGGAVANGHASKGGGGVSRGGAAGGGTQAFSQKVCAVGWGGWGGCAGLDWCRRGECWGRVRCGLVYWGGLMQ